MSSSFSEKKGLWGLLSLTGSQNLPQVDLILYLPFFFPFALSPRPAPLFAPATQARWVWVTLPCEQSLLYLGKIEASLLAG